MKQLMADCATLPWCAGASLQRSQFNSKPLRFSQRKFIFFGKTYLRKQVLSLKIYEERVTVFTTPRGSQRQNKSSLKCFSLGALIDPESIMPANLASYLDEALLVVSVILAYVAGAIPQKRALPGARHNTAKQNDAPSSSMSHGRSLENNAEVKSNDSWNEVDEKLSEALRANEYDDNFSSRALQSGSQNKICPLSLFALTEGPRLRLLSATLRQLQKEVNDISLSHGVNRDVWLLAASEIIKRLIQPVCTKWLEDELTLTIGHSDMDLINRISEKLNGDDTVLQNIKRSGKAELYADLFFFRRFGYLRTTCCYDSKFLTKHGIDILEDVIIMLADGIASIYLELISVDSNMSTEINSMGLTLRTMSTRELQRIRNEVALNQWLLQNFESVAAMYEDRFELSVLCRQKPKDPVDSQSKNTTWWEKFAFVKSAEPPTLNYVLISPVSLPVKRTKELRALTGWRYYFSLFLEFSDITTPLVKIVFTKVSNAVSFFLVCMIGRSLGLIFTGIRQSLGWR